ncbi:hypothetical protein [Paraliomyxa miuraensis]|uniref:hypothetical protein n=1 Tax=Paraliomyxa miuraensis TaxID=376150 RepID=UPI00224EF62C|nr:hypothetical protein [Paraliomyxa miuraensis]MCX4245543.1 hypothetical protein [Paraliomyxa miuraensis]
MPVQARFVPWMLAALSMAFVPSCKNRSNTGELTPPDGAVAWDSRYVDVFDDDYTRAPIHLDGRAPNDVRDQRLFAARLGEANLVAEVKVQQVWGEGRYQGRKEQYLEIELQQVMMGELVKGTAERQLLLVEADDPLPGALQGQTLLLFLRWAPGEAPPYHHHLMPTDAEAMAYIAALIEHAKAEGVLDAEGVPVDAGGGKRGRRKGKKAKGKKARKGDAG